MLTDLESADVSGERAAMRGWNLAFIIGHGPITFADHFKEIADGNVSQRDANALVLEAARQIGNIVRRPREAALDDLAVAGAVQPVADGAKDFKAVLPALQYFGGQSKRKCLDEFIDHVGLWVRAGRGGFRSAGIERLGNLYRSARHGSFRERPSRTLVREESARFQRTVGGLLGHLLLTAGQNNSGKYKN